MFRYILSLCIVLSAFYVRAQQRINAQENDLQAIGKVLKLQEQAWNMGNIDEYMQGYWNSDSLRFIGSAGIQYGWKATLSGYKKRYPDLQSMGKLTFTILSIELLSPQSAMVLGKWHLKRTKDEPQGHFMLLFKKINGNWVIVVDHTS